MLRSGDVREAERAHQRQIDDAAARALVAIAPDVAERAERRLGERRRVEPAVQRLAPYGSSSTWFGRCTPVASGERPIETGGDVSGSPDEARKMPDSAIPTQSCVRRCCRNAASPTAGGQVEDVAAIVVARALVGVEPLIRIRRRIEIDTGTM